MRPFLFVLILALFSADLFSFSVVGPEQSNFTESFKKNNPSQAIFLDAQRILCNISSTCYSHDTTVNDEKGLYEVDCSGLLYYILKHSIPLAGHYDEFMAQAKKEGHQRPLAETFYKVFDDNKSPYWHRIKYLKNAHPGDILVEKYTETYRKETGTTSTGHVMIIAGYPEKVDSRLMIHWKKVKAEKYTVFRVPVIDSSHGYHSLDTRASGAYVARKGEYKNHSGVGFGVIYLGTDDRGTIEYIQWSEDRDAVFNDFVISRAARR